VLPARPPVSRRAEWFAHARTAMKSPRYSIAPDEAGFVAG